MSQGPISDYSVARAFANVAAAQTDSSVVAAVAGKRIRVFGFILSCGGTATTLVFNSKGSGAGTAISATFNQGINGQFATSQSGAGWFETNVGEGLTVTTGAGATTGIQVVFAFVNP